MRKAGAFFDRISNEMHTPLLNHGSSLHFQSISDGNRCGLRIDLGEDTRGQNFVGFIRVIHRGHQCRRDRIGRRDPSRNLTDPNHGRPSYWGHVRRQIRTELTGRSLLEAGCKSSIGSASKKWQTVLPFTFTSASASIGTLNCLVSGLKSSFGC